MGSKTPNLQLELTGSGAPDSNSLFSVWRSYINGEGVGSNMELIDAAFGELKRNADKCIKEINGIAPSDSNGSVTLTFKDIGAMPDDYTPDVTTVNGETGNVVANKIYSSTIDGPYITCRNLATTQTYSCGVINPSTGEELDLYIENEDKLLYRYVNSNDIETVSEIYNSNNVQSIFDLIFPVGSIYINTVNISPAQLFGGTWERIKDAFLLASGDGYELGSTGGEDKVTLTEDAMPRHNHRSAQTSNATDYVFQIIRNLETDATRRIEVTSTSGTGLYVMGTNIKASDSIGSTDVTYSSITAYTGNNGTHNNMPPYLVVNIWKRVA